jgi:hypothetical protein
MAALLEAAAVARQSTEGARVPERFWPQWRGPYATGVSRYASPPLEWSETKSICTALANGETMRFQIEDCRFTLEGNPEV